jgi:hypothetical protein
MSLKPVLALRHLGLPAQILETGLLAGGAIALGRFPAIRIWFTPGSGMPAWAPLPVACQGAG